MGSYEVLAGIALLGLGIVIGWCLAWLVDVRLENNGAE
jgi:hypothetical protein